MTMTTTTTTTTTMKMTVREQSLTWKRLMPLFVPRGTELHSENYVAHFRQKVIIDSRGGSLTCQVICAAP